MVSAGGYFLWLLEKRREKEGYCRRDYYLGIKILKFVTKSNEILKQIWEKYLQKKKVYK